MLRVRRLDAVKDSLLHVLNGWFELGSIPEIDWNGRVKSLEFQETLRARDEEIKRLSTYKCRECPDFDNHVCTSFARVTFPLTLSVVCRRPWRAIVASQHHCSEDGHLRGESRAHT